MESKILSVSSETPVVKLADAIFATLKDLDDIYLVAIGSYAVNQMTKALCIASGKFIQKGKQIAWYSYFEDIEGRKDDKTLTGIKTKVFFMK
jgi:stage V sporulation protein SpoVS